MGFAYKIVHGLLRACAPDKVLKQGADTDLAVEVPHEMVVCSHTLHFWSLALLGDSDGRIGSSGPRLGKDCDPAAAGEASYQSSD